MVNVSKEFVNAMMDGKERFAKKRNALKIVVDMVNALKMNVSAITPFLE